VPAGSAILSSPVPAWVESSLLWGTNADTPTVLGAMAPAARHLRWTTKPSGVMNLYTFDGFGRLWGVTLADGQYLLPPKKLHGCWYVGTGIARIPLAGHIFSWPWEMTMTYTGPAATIGVEFSGTWHYYQLPAGSRELWIQAPGSGAAVFAKLVTGGPLECVSSLTVSASMQTSTRIVPMPYLPVPG
jgi:hypothetical protein